MKGPYHDPFARLIWAIWGGDVELAEGEGGRIFEALHSLSAREERVVRLQYGLPPESQPRSLAEIAELCFVSPERIRQIGAKALRKLRHPSRTGHIRGFTNPGITGWKRTKQESQEFSRRRIRLPDLDDATYAQISKWVVAHAPQGRFQGWRLPARDHCINLRLLRMTLFRMRREGRIERRIYPQVSFEDWKVLA